MALIQRTAPLDTSLGMHPRWRRLGRGVLALFAFCILFAWIGGVTRLHVDRPLVYQGDALEMIGYFDHDYIHNDLDTRLHAPFELDRPQRWYYAYNALFQSNSNLVWLAHIAGGGGDVRTLNLAFLATFLLVFVGAYWACGRLGLRNPFRFGAASLYALMPFHFQQGIGHFFESCYYLTPLLALVVLQLWSARPLAHRMSAEGWQFTWRDPRAILAVVLVLFLSSFHPYHEFFFAVLAASVAPLAALYRRNWRPLIVGLVLALLAVAVLQFKDLVVRVLVAPEVALSYNGQAISWYGQAEFYPLKLAQMLMPVEGHRWHKFADLRATYDLVMPLVNENKTTTLGAWGGFGLLAGLALALVPSPRWRMSRAGKMGLVSLIALLFAGMGGFSSLISTASYVMFGPKFPLTQTRGWDRMVIFIGFFAYFTAFWLLRGGLLLLHRRWLARVPRAVVLWPAFAIVFGIALWDLVPRGIAQESAAHYNSDQRYFGRIERTLPEGARIFQLPFVIHHVSAWVQPGVLYADALRPFLSTKTLHFTYGSDQSSEQIDWYAAAAKLPADRLTPYLCGYGFSGVLVQRNMLKDPAAVENPLTSLFGNSPSLSGDGDFAFYDLRGYCAGHAHPTFDVAAIKAGLIARLKQGVRVIPGAALAHLVGHPQIEADGSIAWVGAADDDGWMAYGPGETIDWGRYRATFDLDVDTTPAAQTPIGIDVVGRRDGKEAQLASKLISAGSEVRHPALDFSVPRNVGNLQYRIHKPRGYKVTLYNVELQRTGR